MVKCVSVLALGLLCAGPAFGQLEVVNLREDVRGLSQRVAELSLRVEQLERQNSELNNRAGAVDRAYVTLTVLNQSLADVNRNIQTAVAQTRSETLAQVGSQLEKLARQTNAAIDALDKKLSPKAPAAGATGFPDDYPKEGISYTVLKGDTLPGIARKTGAKLQDIINANKISDPSHIVAGETLFIPGGK